MDWYEVTGEYHARTFEHACRLSSLPTDWQRELAALWRLEGDVNNGGYLQFLTNWGKESYVYASQALKKMGAHTMAEIVDGCQALLDEHVPCEEMSLEELRRLLPNRVIDRQGRQIKDVGSLLPESVIARIYELSYRFMDYPDDVADLGRIHYRAYIEGDGRGRTDG